MDKSKFQRRVVKSIFAVVAVVAVVCVVPSRARAADQPLTKDDVLLLLLGGASTQKMIGLIEQRGVDFKMNPDLAKKFHDAGADDMVIEALQKAGAKVQPSSAGLAPSPGTSTPSIGATPPPAAPAVSAPPPASSDAELDRKIADTYAGEPGEHPLAPAFSLVDLTGQKQDLATYAGKVVLVNFWATWCPPCRTEIPKLIELQDDYGRKGLQVLGIVVNDTRNSVEEFFKMIRPNYPVAMVTPEVRRSFGGLAALPASWLIGPDGRVYAEVKGAPADLNGFDRLIKRLLAEQPAGQQVASNRTQASPTAPRGAASVPVAKSQSSKTLPDPSPEQIQQIIQAFAAKEKMFKEARDNYTFHQINKVEQLDPEGGVVGTFQQEWDILYDDAGKRLERVTYAPPDTLKNLIVTKEDLDSMRNIQPFVLTTEELPDYDVKYLGHVRVDEITAYVFSIRPKEIKKARLYFQGTAWVDDRDLQIVKTEGRIVPELKTSKGENLFPRFTTYREQIDGKFWFPTYTYAKDTLYFSSGAVDMKEIIRYSDYKQFKSKVRILATEVADTPSPQSNMQPQVKK
ncbi:MAG: redoxin domain-containing protein [Acidobacteriia bacterium]|nr:redoxin domain-containing protein [Terriglobia bacterium]